MPLVKIQTNASLSPEAERDLLSQSTAIIARELGKPESVMMASAETEVAMLFGGDPAPTALFEIEALDYDGGLSQPLVDELSDLAERLLGVSAGRVFVKITNVPRGSWAGGRKIF